MHSVAGTVPCGCACKCAMALLPLLLALSSASADVSPPPPDASFVAVTETSVEFHNEPADGSTPPQRLFQLGRDGADGGIGDLKMRAGDGAVAFAVEPSGGGVRADKLRSGSVEDVGAAVAQLQDRVACLTDVVSFQAAGGAVTDLPPALCTCLHGDAAGDRCSFLGGCDEAPSATAAEYWLVPGGDTSQSERVVCADGDAWPEDTDGTFAATKFLLQSSRVDAGTPSTVPVYVPGDADAAMSAAGTVTVARDSSEGAFPAALTTLAAGTTLTQAHSPHFDLDSHDFTLDFWAKLEDSSQGANLVMIGMQAYEHSSYPSCVWTTSGISIQATTSRQVYVRMSHHISQSGTEASPLCTSDENMVAASGEWAHYSVQKQGGTAAAYVNGVRVCHKTDIGSFDITPNGLDKPISLGKAYAGNSPGTCNIAHSTSATAVSYDLVRLTVGTTRFDIDGFTPPDREPRE